MLTTLYLGYRISSRHVFAVAYVVMLVTTTRTIILAFDFRHFLLPTQ